jgi:hypothetical protein
VRDRDHLHSRDERAIFQASSARKEKCQGARIGDHSVIVSFGSGRRDCEEVHSEKWKVE